MFRAHVLETCRGRNKLTVKQKFCASSWLITDIKKRLENVDSIQFLRVRVTTDS